MADVKFVMKAEPAVLNWPLKLNIAQDGGTVEVQTVMAKLKMLTADDRAALDAAQKDPEIGVVAYEQKFYDLAVKGFVDFNDESGKPVSDEVAMPFFRDMRPALIAVMVATSEMMTGRPAALAKN